ncbi:MULTISPECIES: type II toxin-antitoxin system RelE/ParE family toxin [Chryseobacterium]|uniref:type II toxin-antitoxin system RelE/ParE family toxin n=1 Tax=Chryseobacterium TaxID=59732 RepID=UPI0021E57A5F|nr:MULTISPECIES: type II toxin-antitoxin system RelE/ParE family toxin [Chryseobacterium]MEC5174523.1 toxin ParE1/3/4 [Chryseobacterium nepalense]
MGNYFLTHKAVEDITKIYEYTYEFWSEKQADLYYEELINYFQLLCENPYIGKNYTEIKSDIYGFTANKHIIFYRILNTETIEIERILGTDMDLKNRMKE